MAATAVVAAGMAAASAMELTITDRMEVPKAVVATAAAIERGLTQQKSHGALSKSARI